MTRKFDSDSALAPGRSVVTTGRVMAALLWLGSASVLGQLVSWVSTIVVIRLLSPHDYGLMAMAGLSIAFLLTVGDLGVGTVIVQAPTLDQTKLRALFGVALLTHLVGAVTAFVSAPLVAAFFTQPRLIPLIRALSVCFVFAGVYALPQALIVRALEFGRKARVDMATTLVASMVALTLAMTGCGVWSLVGAMLATHAFRAIVFQVLCPCLVLPSLSRAALHGNLRFGGWVTLDRILWFGYTNLDVAIAGRALGGTLVGVYSVALSLVSMPLDKMMSVVNEVSLSAFARVQDDREQLRRGMLRAIESVSLLGFPAFLGMAVVAEGVVHLFLGPRWADAVLPLQILCLAFPFRAIGLLFAPALFGTGQARVVVVNNALTLGCMAVALSIGVRWGILGLCVGWVVGYIPVFVIIAHRSLAALDIPLRQVVKTMGFSMSAAGMMAVTVEGTHYLLGEAWPPAVALASLVLIGAVTYGALVLTFRPWAFRSLSIVSSGR